MVRLILYIYFLKNVSTFFIGSKILTTLFLGAIPLKYPWHRSMPRLEARRYIENYGPNDVWLGKTMYM